MGFNARVLRVLIASPGDVQTERDAIVQAILRWDANRSAGAGLLFLPRRWEIDAVPQLTGTDGQTVINEQLVRDADVVIAVFHSRLGAATPRAASGTAEELQHAHEAGKPVHVWFSRAGFPPNVDLAQISALREFRQSLQDLGLVGEYDDVGDLQQQEASALELDANTFAHEALGDEVVARRTPKVEGVRLRARYLSERETRIDSHGRTNHHTRGQRIEVENQGDGTAQRVRLVLVGTDGNPGPEIGTEVEPDILGHSIYPFPVFPDMSSSVECNLTMTWNEGNDEHQVTQAIYLA